MRQKHEYYVDDHPASGMPAGEIAGWVYDRVCRHDFFYSGFVLINLPPIQDSHQLRCQMIELKQELAVIHRARTGQHLVYTSMSRFDQQVTTKPHRDGGPDQGLLMLGYEPTSIRSRLRMADYTKCAFDLRMQPEELLRLHNPMYADGERILRSYTTLLEGVDPANHQILIINNSCAPFNESAADMLGVLHQAVIENPTPGATRIVNSTMIAPVGRATAEPISRADQERFLTTNEVSNGAYG